MKALLAKVAGLLIWFVVFSWLMIGAHEMGHYLGAVQIGLGGGNVQFTWATGVYYAPPNVPISSFQNVIYSLAGGLLVALTTGVIWAVEHIQLKYANCAWGLDTIFALSVVALWQGLYSVSEIWNWQVYGSLISIVLAVAISLLLYGKRLREWLEV